MRARGAFGGVGLEFKQVVERPAKGLVGGVILGLVIGAVLPFVALVQISLLVPVLMLGGIFTVALKARYGWAPACALAAAAMASSAWFIGMTIALMLLAASLAPALAIVRAMGRKAPFFEQMKLGVAAYGLGLLAAMLVMYAGYGAGMVARFVDLLRAEYDRMSDAALMPLVEWVNTALSAGGALGVRQMTVEQFRAQMTGILDLMQQTYARMLPGTLLSGALLSGVLSVLWGNWIMARQGRATNESFVGMSRWFLPPGVTGGCVAMWLAGLLLAYGGYENGATVYATISALVGATFAIQALCAADRRMLAAGRSLARRRTLLVIVSVLALLLPDLGMVLSYLGMFSALFGSHGAVRKWRDGRQNDRSDDDSEE